MLTLAALCIWVILVLLAGWWLTRTAEPLTEPPKPPRDPIVELVDKWAHDWERGRA